jgi:hypothetical protein
MRLLCGVMWLCWSATPALGQSGWVVGGGIAYLEHRVDAGYGRERFSGLALQLSIERQFGRRLTLGLRGEGGGLEAAAGDLDRRIGEAEASARVTVGAMWGVYGGLVLRAIASDAGRQRWTFGRLGAEVRPAFTDPHLRAIGRLGIIPFTSVPGLAPASITVDGAVGLEYAGKRFSLGFLYGLERFALTAGNTNRAEQMSRLTLRGGYRISGHGIEPRGAVVQP